jgi:hypothetical protein
MREEAATGGFKPLRDHFLRQGVTGEKPAEGQLFDRVGVLQIEPRFRLGIARRLAHAQRIFGDVAAPIEDAVRQHQCRHGHVRIEPHIVRPLLGEPGMDLHKGGLVGDTPFGEREARDHRIIGGRRVIEARDGCFDHGWGATCVS